ncbi:E3 SUMO-protein ligase PIAS2-like [Uloborus diversus]|uniref:E3 SUMO-protein ligase PIAS2-like n=1 Tax=Uloborus diversus TaxID=327109 RepID=UPI00240A462D|nr:E3 SUMO-protein ligase PIAS2-like [Uloborus diversus]
MAESDLRNMIMNFRVSDLQVLLGFAGRNKTGKKQELQGRALDLVKIKSPAVDMKVRELHGRRYHNQIVRTNSYEVGDRNVNDRPMPHYDSSMNNNYPAHCNSTIRPTVNQGPIASYSSGKPYMPPIQTANSHSSFSPYIDVKFKELPFYDVLHVLMRPCSLVADVAERFQETNYYFTLTPKQAHEIAVSRDATGNFECQILLRFCSLDTSCEQEDNFPPSISIKVNGKNVTLPNPIPTNRPGVEPKRPSKPVNITHCTKLSPTVNNLVNVSWATTYGRSFAVALYIARQLSSQTLLQRLRANGVGNPDHTTAMIKEKLQQGQDSEIAMTSLRGSLLCPLGKIKMEMPCRAITCNHLQCFDASLYIQMNEKKPKWVCPVCDKPAVFKSLVIDGLFMDIATRVPPECSEVEFNENGSWTPILPVKEPKEPKKAVVEKGPPKAVEIVDVSSDSDSEEYWPYDVKPQQENIPLVTNGDVTPPVVYLPIDPNEISNLPIPVTSTYAPPSTITPMGSETLCMPSALPNEPAEPVCILPDINVGVPDPSLPSTSSSAANLGTSHYLPISSSQYPPSEAAAYSQSLSSSYQETQNLLHNQHMSSYNGFDLFSLLETPVEPHKLREYEQKEAPDVISLE